jgi:hypothetical protein
MTRKGKIARLPRNIRETLNSRLEDGEVGSDLVLWLNTLPEVRSILASQFEGSPITPQNLSQWKQGGFLDWQRNQYEKAGIEADRGKSTQIVADRLFWLLRAQYPDQRKQGKTR